MTDKFDVEYLAINQLAYSFNKFTQLNSSTDTPHDLVEIATRSFQLMKRYEVVHPLAESLLQFLSNQGVSVEECSHEWVSNTRSLNEAYLLQLDHDMRRALDQAMEALSPVLSAALFGKIKRAIIITAVQGSYEEGLVLLNNYLSLVDFSSQPKTKEKFIENRYMEFLFYQYVLNKFSLIWFPNEDLESRRTSSLFNSGKYNKVTITSNSYKPMNQIYSKTTAYYQKNETLFSSSDIETQYYWSIKFLHLTLMFKQFKFVEFYDEFVEYFLHQKEPIDLLTGDLAILKTNLLVMFGIASIFLKPFNSLTLLGIGRDDVLVDLLGEDPDSFEYKFYTQVMIPLSKCNFSQAKACLENHSFVKEMLANLEYNFPVSCRTTDGSYGPSFIVYLKLIIDMKNFFMILTSSTQISKSKLFQLLGYSESDSLDDIHDLNSTFIGVIVALDLGRYGITYDAGEEVFSHQPVKDSSKEIATLQENITDLQNEVKAVTLSNKMTELLLEKYFG